MKKLYSDVHKREGTAFSQIILFVVFLFVTNFSYSQTLLLQESFEGDASNYDANTFSDGGSDYFITMSNAIRPLGFPRDFSSIHGIMFMGGEDIASSDNPFGSSASGYVVLSSQNVSGYTSVELKINLAAVNNSGFDMSFEQANVDGFSIQYAFDGDIATPGDANVNTGTYTKISDFRGNMGIDTSHLYEDVNLDGVGEGAVLNETFQEFTYNIPVSGQSSISIRIVVSADSGSEELGVDNIRIYGVGASNTAPTVTTQAVSVITSTTATGNGNITDLGSPNPTQYGVCWNTTGTPTVADSKTEEGAITATGAFDSNIIGLISGTTYYVRAYATNSAGTSYGSQVSFTTVNIPLITTMPQLTVAYNKSYSYGIVATTEGELETIISVPTVPAWLTASADGQSQASLFGDIPEGVSISGVAGDDEGNIYAITSDGTTIYKIAPDGNTTLWRNGLISGQVYALHIANGYLYIPRYSNPSQSITRLPLNNSSATEETFASIAGGALSLTDKDGWIYAADLNSTTISRINEDSKAVELLLNSSDGVPKIGTFGLTFDQEGNLYIATWDNKSILKYDGSSITTVLSGLPNRVSSIRQDKRGNFYLSMQNGGVRKYTQDFSSYEDVALSTSDNIWSLSFTSSGALVYAKYGTNEVYRLQTGAILSGTPSKSDLGDHPVVIRATNDAGYVEQAFTITVIDTIKPAVSVFSPLNNATAVGLKPTLSITFDEEISLASTGTLSLISGGSNLKTYDLSVVEDKNAIIQSADNKSISIEISESLPVNSLIAIEISSGFVKDLSDNANAEITAASGSWNFTTINTPTIATAGITIFGTTTATMGGEVTDNGGSSIGERGVVYSETATNSNPEIGGTGVTKFAASLGTGTGAFNESITGLKEGTSYSVKAYAINSAGIFYGSAVVFKTHAIPVITASQVFNIDENALNNASVGTILATDDDANTTFSSWTITAGNEEGIFVIDESTGAITIADNTNLDFETITNYTLSVTVSDGENTSSAQTISVNVSDINDEVPVITASQTFNIDEDVVNSAIIGTILATDADAGTTFSSWTITAGNEDAIFVINESTGEITIADNTNLDFETTTTFTLSVTVGDGKNTSSVQTVNVNVTDINDELPVITASQTFNIDEDVVNNASVGTVLATDEDAGTTFSSWTIRSGNYDAIFTINSNTGEIVVDDNSNLDFETSNTYVLEISVSDGVNTSFVETVNIDIEDTNEAPTAISLSNTTIAENLAIGSEVGTLTASDVDASQTFTYTIADNENFEIVGDRLLNKAVLDYEAQNSYSVEITVTDQGGLTHKQSFSIEITDENEVPSEIQLSNTTIAENLAIGSEVGILTATDEDAAQTFTYTIVENENFEIVGDQLVSKVAFDFETENAYSLEITVTDQGGLTHKQSFSIEITDENEVPSEIQLSNTIIAENLAIGSEVGILTTTDEDAAQTFTYTIVENENFEIVGDQLVSKVAFDFETENAYSLEIIVTDQGGLTHKQSFSIEITDENEVPSEIQLSNTTIAENLAIGSEVGILTVTDEDAAQTFTYTIVENENFEIVGDKLVSKVAFDFETENAYSLEITVTDQGGLTHKQSFSIEITDKNEVPSEIQLSNTTIAENLAIGSEVGILTATDEDAAQTFTYTIADNENFELTGDKLVSKSVFDYEAQNSYSVEITVSDQGGLNHKQSFDIQISDENEAPTAISLSNTTIAENSAIGTEVGILTATDEDAAQTFTYTIVENENFELTGDRLLSKSVFDYEAQNSYSVEITVTDQGGLTHKQSFSIEITDENEVPSEIQLSNTTIAENLAIGSEVGILTATDEDAAQTFTYTIVENENFEIVGDQLVSKVAFDFETENAYSLEITVTDQGGLTHKQSFSIEITDENEVPSEIQLSNTIIAENLAIGSEVGILTTTDEDAAQTFTYTIVENENFEIVGDQLVSKVAFDFETQNSYSVEITVTDQGGLTHKQSFSIEITDENEVPSEIQLSNTTIAENLAIGSEVGILTVTDEDAAQTFTYTIVENENFEIVGDQLVSKVAFDFETENAYSLEITVTDQGGLTHKQSFDIQISDENEAPTAISLSNTTIAENSAIGTEVGILTATDEDAAQTFTYTIVENENFEIVGDRLMSKSVFDYEAQNSYSVEITVSDQEGLTHKQSFDIQISDENEAPTAISLSNTAIAENLAIGTEVGILTATDEDADQTFTYTITENENFEIVGDRLLSKAVFNFVSKNSYTVEISVKDQSNLSISKAFTIQILNTNESPTAIQLSNASIAENSSIGNEVGILTATDPDVNETFTYSVSANDYFEADGNKLITKGEFNYEDHISYSIKIIVTDQGGLSFDERFTINIEDVNEAPEFISDANTSAVLGEMYSYTVEYLDQDADGCLLTAFEIPSWLTLVDNKDGTGTLSGIPAQGGSYQVILEASDSEFAVQQEFELVVETVTGIEDITIEPVVNIYPNPVVNELHIDLSNFEGQDLNIAFYALTGKLIFKESYQSIGEEVSVRKLLQDLGSGMYLLVLDMDGVRKTYKIVKE